jgi:hypothetical protein
MTVAAGLGNGPRRRCGVTLWTSGFQIAANFGIPDHPAWRG